jgi:hypothetical protein
MILFIQNSWNDKIIKVENRDKGEGRGQREMGMDLNGQYKGFLM